MKEIVFTALFPFCGLGAGARGFLDAEMRLLGYRATFRSLGGIDVDAAACRDFEYLTDSPAWCQDILGVTGAELRRRYGETAPDVVFCSAPCRGASSLLSVEKSKTKKYADMNELSLVWMRAMLDAWPDPPALVLFENVPRLKTRAAGMLLELRRLLGEAGYVFDERTHDCGEVGGLGQRRRRYLLVARLPEKAPPLLYQPPKKRVRSCGEVIGPLPMPGDPAAGPMHALPRISWLNWIRLALIPAGGDWRDLPGVLTENQPRREVFRRHLVSSWDEPTATIAGSGSKWTGSRGRSSAARVVSRHHRRDAVGGACHAVTGRAGVSTGKFAVADPRFGLTDNPNRHWNKYVVVPWEEPSKTVIGATRPGSGSQAVADPRPQEKDWFHHVLRVVPWGQATGVVTSANSPSSGATSVADPRVERAFNGAYGVLSWDEAAKTITGEAMPSTGSFAVADPRRPNDPPLCVVHDVRKPPIGGTPIIIAEDGTWHRPLTTLELAALQGLPMVVKGQPLKLDGTYSSGWRERIGNAVPSPAARAIAEQMLATLVQAAAGTSSLGMSDTPVWVVPEELYA